MTRRRCVKNQIEAEELFGDRASECNSCPCDQGLALRGKTTTIIPAVPSVISTRGRNIEAGDQPGPGGPGDLSDFDGL